MWKGTERIHLTFFFMAEDYHYTSEDTVLFTTQAKGEQSKRQRKCKEELILFCFHFNWLALKIRLTLKAFCMHHFCPLASPEWCHQWPANLTMMLTTENTSPYIIKKIIWILIFTTIVSAPMTMSGDFRWFYSRWMHNKRERIESVQTYCIMAWYTKSTRH